MNMATDIVAIDESNAIGAWKTIKDTEEESTMWCVRIARLRIRSQTAPENFTSILELGRQKHLRQPSDF